MHHRVACQSGGDVSGSTCCKRPSQPSAPATAQSATVQFSIEPAESTNVAIPTAPFSRFHLDRTNARQNHSSRASLCTFQI